MVNRKTKIVATLGPSSQDEKTITRLIQAGMDVARLNFSHGTHENYVSLIDTIRKLSAKLNKPITILQDLQGPKLRVGKIPSTGIDLIAGQMVVFKPPEESANESDNQQNTIIPLDVPNLLKSASPGNRILLDDGNMEMEITQLNDNSIEARVILGGKLTSFKGVNLPRADLGIAGFTKKDKNDLEFGLQQGVDIVAISFVKNADDIALVRNAIREISPNLDPLPIIAKLERPEAVENLVEIIKCVDGVMVARGDLAVETSPSEVPIMQKQIIQTANQYGKMVITATQMLDSMIHNPRPTRAEASDVANAVFDGTDAVMLSGETASGQYPVESVSMMQRIIIEAEAHYKEWGQCQTNLSKMQPTGDDAIAITQATKALAEDRQVAAIAVFTQSGRTALLISKARPRVDVMAFTPDVRTFQKMGLLWGVTPYLVPYESSIESMLSHVEASLLSSTTIKPGEQIVLVAGFPVGKNRQANYTLLHTIGSYSKSFHR